MFFRGHCSPCGPPIGWIAREGGRSSWCYSVKYRSETEYGRNTVEQSALHAMVRDLNGIEPKIEIAAIGRIRKRVPSLKFIVPLSRAYDLFLPSSPPLCVNETGDKRNRVAAA